MHRFYQHLLLYLFALQICGGQHGLMQVVAWTQMAVRYSAESGLNEGLEKTFDGKHPCPLCKALAEAREKEKSHDEQPPPNDLEKKSSPTFCSQLDGILGLLKPPHTRLPHFELMTHRNGFEGDAPPLPPPRKRICS